jgi:two-component system CheB/CheR fusion protein
MALGGALCCAEDRVPSQVCMCSQPGTDAPKIAVVDDDYFARTEMKDVLEGVGWEVEVFASCERFLESYHENATHCLVLDIHFEGMDGLELLNLLAATRNPPPVIMISGSSGIPEAVTSMRVGALDFVEKPVVGEKLVASVKIALGEGARASRAFAFRDAGQVRDAALTSRERQVMELVLAGSPSKNIAADLGISQRTVESHRASIMHKMGADSVPALTRMIMCRSCPLAA